MITGRIVALGVVTLAATAAAQPPAARREGLIVGQVVDAGSGRPLSTAIVSLGGLASTTSADGRPSALPRILTGTDGRFVFRDLHPGSFAITVTRIGYADGAYGRRRPNGPPMQITLADGERVGDVVIRMWKHAAISGTVVDEAGEPLVLVQVRALRRTLVPSRPRYVLAATTSTDDRGAYRLANLIPGEYMVGTSSRQIAIPLSLAQDSHAGSRTAGSAIVEIGGSTSLPGTSTALQVGNTVYPVGQGTPVPPLSSGGRLLGYPGTFHPSALTLAAGEERGGIDLHLHPVPTRRISGTVIGPDPAGITVPIRLRPVGGDDLPPELDWPTTITDSKGTFTFPAVPAGDYVLRVATRVHPMHWAEIPVTVASADIDGLTITLQAGLRITGRVEFDGQRTRPTSEQLVQVPVVIESVERTWDRTARAVPTKLSGSGEFATDGLPAGRYFVRVQGSPVGWMFKGAIHGGRDLSETPLDLQGGDAAGVVIAFTDRWSGMRGVVRSARGTADVEATVLVFPTEPHRWTDLSLLPRRVRTATTRKNGEFSFTALPPGDYYALALTDEQAADWQDPPFMAELARIATRVTIGDGEQKTQDLRMVEVR